MHWGAKAGECVTCVSVRGPHWSRVCSAGHAEGSLTCSVAGALSFGTILWTALACSRTFCLLKGLVPFVPIVLLLQEKKNEEREESWDPSMGECLYLYKAVTEEEIFFSDHFKMVSPISFKFKMHLDLLRRIWQGAKVPGVTESWCDPKHCAAGQALLPSPVWWRRAPGICCIPCMEGLRLNQMLSLELSERIGVGMLN